MSNSWRRPRIIVGFLLLKEEYSIFMLMDKVPQRREKWYERENSCRISKFYILFQGIHSSFKMPSYNTGLREAYLHDSVTVTLLFGPYFTTFWRATCEWNMVVWMVRLNLRERKWNGILSLQLKILQELYVRN